MSNATLVVTATLTNGGITQDVELQQAQRAINLAVAQVRVNGTRTTSGTVTEGAVSATYTYTPVASH